MSVVDVVFIIALVLFVIEQFNAQGRSLMAWGGILVCVGLLWGNLAP